MSIEKQWIIAIVLGLAIFSFLSNCVPKLIDEAHQQLCDDGTLVDELCLEHSTEGAGDDHKVE